MKRLSEPALALACAFAMASAANAQQTQAQPAPAAPTASPPALASAPEAATTMKKAPNPNKKICRTVPVVGRMIGDTTCLTQAQWAARDAAAQDQMNSAETQSNGLSPH